MTGEYLLHPLCFAFELLCCEAIFVLHQRQRRHFALRLLLSLLVYFGAMVALNLWYIQRAPNVMLSVFFFSLFFVGAAAVLPVCFQLTWGEAFFAAAAGYSVQHIADSLVKIAMLGLPDGTVVPLGRLALILTLPYLCCAALFCYLVVKPAALDEKLQLSDRRVLGVSAVNLIICLVLSIVSSEEEIGARAFLLCRIYAILGCILCLVTQVGLLRDGKMARNNQILQQMIQLERNQHRLSKETIDFINIRCHDLRHQIDRLNSLSDEKRRKSVEELSRATMIYDSIIKTGNDALDTVLMEKKLLCEKYHIRFSFIGDGTVLSMLDEVDIYSLFGNILDNAIESLSQEPDEEKRLITLRMEGRREMLYIEEDNYYSTPILYQNGEIQTSKQHEPGMHGFGLKSIAYIVNSYHGDLLIQTENHHFVLQIMLPDTVKS